jgi:hypothetical protein
MHPISSSCFIPVVKILTNNKHTRGGLYSKGSDQIQNKKYTHKLQVYATFC